MAEKIESAHKGRPVAYAVLAIAVVAGSFFGVTQLAGYGEPVNSSSDSAVTPTDAATPQEGDMDKLTLGTSKLIPESKSGQDAVDALGDKLAVAAKRNNMTPEALKELLLRDKTAHVSSDGFLKYIDTLPKRP